MKAYLILSILLATILFFPSSILARELAAVHGANAGSGTGGTTNPNRPVCDPKKGGKYQKCDPKSGSKPCGGTYGRKCPPSGS